MSDKPADPESCFSLRTFTELKDGTFKEGSLRTAACVRRGLRFAGRLCCAAEDAELIRQALAGIQWAGTMRSRGFGHIRVTAAEMPEEQNVRSAVRQAVCLCRSFEELARIFRCRPEEEPSIRRDLVRFLIVTLVVGLIIWLLARYT